MDEQTMVERSGRAALAASDIGISEDESYEDFDKRRAIAAGRAAIEAMRPDASTMGLIRKLAKKTGLNAADIDLAVCFYIDAALAEERREASPPKA